MVQEGSSLLLLMRSISAQCSRGLHHRHVGVNPRPARLHRHGHLHSHNCADSRSPTQETAAFLQHLFFTWLVVTA